MRHTISLPFSLCMSSRSAPLVLVNREQVLPPAVLCDGFDLNLLGDCDDIVRVSVHMHVLAC